MNTPDISYHYANFIVGTLPGERYEWYENSNFEDTTKDVLGEIQQLVEDMGIFNINIQPSLLIYLKPWSYAVLFIGLVFDILLIVFVAVSTLLIYSLLLISVETKTFEIGVMRLVGLTKMGFVAMIFTQACMFVLPAVISGFIAFFPIIHMLYASLFKDDLGYMPSIVPSGSAVLLAFLIGILIPLFSSIVPIRTALSTNLNDALNTNRSKSTGVLISFINKNT